MTRHQKIETIFNWEYWPTPMFYLPNLPYAFYLAIKAKHTTFFSAANPSIKSSGNGAESKYDTLQLIPEKFRPKTVFVTQNCSVDSVLEALKVKKIAFPIIAKPNIGFKGLLVQKLASIQALESYLNTYPIDILLQEFLDYENECGIFYHKNPTQKKGCISSITLKRFLSVVGNGTSSLEELIKADKRARRYSHELSERHKDVLDKIPSNGKVIQLTVIGNHAKGTQFICGEHLITKKLVHTFDQLSASIDGWYYGRVDVKYNSFTELENGMNYKVLEINGIISEPTHMYDSENYTYLQALKAIRRHWKSLYYVATTNNKYYKVPYKRAGTFINEVLNLRSYTQKLKQLSKSN